MKIITITLDYSNCDLEKRLVAERIVQEIYQLKPGNLDISLFSDELPKLYTYEIKPFANWHSDFGSKAIAGLKELKKVGVIIKIKHNTGKPVITIEKCEKVVCNYFNMPIEKLHSDTRKREVVQARQIAMYFSKELTKHSLRIIGEAIGDRDHSTVLHACKVVNDQYQSGLYWDNTRGIMVNYRAMIDDIEKLLKR